MLVLPCYTCGNHASGNHASGNQASGNGASGNCIMRGLGVLYSRSNLLESLPRKHFNDLKARARGYSESVAIKRH